MKNLLSPLQSALDESTFIKLSIGNYKGFEPDLKNIYIRRILIKREEKLSFTYHYKTRDIVKNFDTAQALRKIEDALKEGFNTATLFTTEFDLVLDNGKIKKNKPTNSELPAPTHDRTKKRMIETTGKHYLHALEITDTQGAVYKTAQDKYRQIDKYVEILSTLIKNIPHQKLKKIVDMGSGKGYLTFALYDYLANTLKTDTKITGVEARADMVKLCNKIAAASEFKNLDFVQGTIQDYDSTGANILIALHACDTATDDAIYKGITASAELIVVAPCCHKQIRREMERGAPDPALAPLLRHGIFMERQAEMATDTLRALLLEHAGYSVKVFEFISDAHTPKNVMIVAEKGTKIKQAETLKKIAATKTHFGITHHHLEKLMGI